MPDAMWLVCAGILSLLGMSWLAAAMNVHWQQLFAGRGTRPKSGLLRALASIALIASGMGCLQADHASMAILVWVMLLTGAAFTTAMILSRQPALLRIACPKFLGQAVYPSPEY